MRFQVPIVLLLLLIINIHTLLAQKENYKIVYQQLAWSPDGQGIFFTFIKVKPDWSDFSPEKWSLFYLDLKNHQLQKLDSGTLFFSISQSGKLAYDKTIEKNREIFLFDLETGERRNLTLNPAKDGGPTWSPDGRHIAFYSNRDGQEEIYTLSLNDNEINRITDSGGHKCYNPAWSPSSDSIAYFLERGDNKDQIYLTDSNGSFQKNITGDNHHNIFPSWSFDGRIVYSRDKGEIMIMTADGLERELLMQSSLGQVALDSSGKFLLTMNENWDLIKVNLETGEKKIILDSDQLLR